MAYDDRKDRLHLGIRGAGRAPVTQVSRKKGRRGRGATSSSGGGLEGYNYFQENVNTILEQVGLGNVRRVGEAGEEFINTGRVRNTPLGIDDILGAGPIPTIFKMGQQAGFIPTSSGTGDFDDIESQDKPSYFGDKGRDKGKEGSRKKADVDVQPSPQQITASAQDKIEAAASMQEKVVNLEHTGTAEQQVELNQLKEEIALMLEQAELELMRAQDRLGVQDVITESQWDLAGLPADMQLTDVSDALEIGQGIYLTTAEDMRKIANDPNLTQEEKNKAFEIITNRQKFSEEIARTVTDLTNNVQLLKQAEQRPDTALLGEPLGFFNPTMNFATVGINDEDRFITNVLGSVRETVVADHIAALPENDPSLQIYQALLVAVSTNGVDDPRTQQLMRALEQAWGADGITYDVLYRAFGDASTKAMLKQDAWDQALDDKTPLVPGSEGMVAAIAQSAEDITYNGEPIDPEFIDLIAKSKDLHWIIDNMSQGEHGKQLEGGTVAGIGGLTEDMYQYLMGEEWTPTRGKKWELEALIRYVFELYNGDPIAAVNAWRTTGEWGGVGVDLGNG